MADDPTPDLATRLAKLEEDLAAERAENASHKATLRALEADRRAASGGNARTPANLPRLSRQDAQAIADTLGGDWTAEGVQQHYPAFAVMFDHIASPALRAMGGVADTVDELDARTELTDWKDIRDEVTKVRDEHVARGEFISRKKAAAIVKARKLEDPKYQDELADRRLKERETEAAKRAAEAAEQGEATAAATTADSGRAPTQTAGPSPTKGPKPAMDREKFDALPLDEKRKVLDDAAIAF